MPAPVITPSVVESSVSFVSPLSTMNCAKRALTTAVPSFRPLLKARVLNALFKADAPVAFSFTPTFLRRRFSAGRVALALERSRLMIVARLVPTRAEIVACEPVTRMRKFLSATFVWPLVSRRPPEWLIRAPSVSFGSTDPLVIGNTTAPAATFEPLAGAILMPRPLSAPPAFLPRVSRVSPAFFRATVLELSAADAVPASASVTAPAAASEPSAERGRFSLAALRRAGGGAHGAPLCGRSTNIGQAMDS